LQSGQVSDDFQLRTRRLVFGQFLQCLRHFEWVHVDVELSGQVGCGVPH
jgi:hypothetical protein